MPDETFEIDLRQLPEEGLQFTGELDASVLTLREGADSKPAGPVSYDFHISRATDLLVIEGALRAPFTLTCVRSLEEFEYVVDMPEYRLDWPAKEGPIVNLTERLREDILLALPTYPHRDESEGPISKSFEFEGTRKPTPEEEQEENKDVWDALDALE